MLEPRIKSSTKNDKKQSIPLFSDGIFNIVEAMKRTKNFLFYSVDNMVKGLGFFVSLCYAVGLVITIFYYNAIAIRSIEFIQTKYIIIGLIFIILFCWIFLIPLTLDKNWKRIVVFIFLFLIWVRSFNGFSKHTFFARSSYQAIQTIGANAANTQAIKFSVLIILFLLIIALIFYLPILILQKEDNKLENLEAKNSQKLTLSNFRSLILAAFVFLLLFTFAIFPQISSHLGGGQLPTAEISFSDQIPDHILQAFDMQDTAGQPPEYYAKVVYTSDDTIFLKPYPWYGTEIYELHKEDVNYLIYVHDLPSDMDDPNE